MSCNSRVFRRTTPSPVITALIAAGLVFCETASAASKFADFAAPAGVQATTRSVAIDTYNRHSAPAVYANSG
jgi:hypothetical protein